MQVVPEADLSEDRFQALWGLRSTINCRCGYKCLVLPAVLILLLLMDPYKVTLFTGHTELSGLCMPHSKQ